MMCKLYIAVIKATVPSPADRPVNPAGGVPLSDASLREQGLAVAALPMALLRSRCRLREKTSRRTVKRLAWHLEGHIDDH
jgi:hypothetical protein